MGLRYRRSNHANHNAPYSPRVQTLALLWGPVGWIAFFAFGIVFQSFGVPSVFTVTCILWAFFTALICFLP